MTNHSDTIVSHRVFLCLAVFETAVSDGQCSGFGVAAELGFYRGRAEAGALNHGEDSRKGKAARELLQMLEAYDVDVFEEEKMTEIRSKAKMLAGQSKRRGSADGKTEMRAAHRGSGGTPLDVMKDRAAIEDW